MAPPEEIPIEVVYALPAEQYVVSLRMPAGSRAIDAVRRSGLLERFTELEPGGRNKLGIFGRPIGPEHELQAGDRVEIYRPLIADPKEVRRRLAAEGRTMGRRKG